MSFQGYIDVLSGGTLSGWVNNNEQRLQVDLILDGEKIATGENNLFREDLIKAGVSKNGYNGFAFYQKELIGKNPDYIKVVARIDQHSFSLPYTQNVKDVFFQPRVSYHDKTRLSLLFPVYFEPSFKILSIFFEGKEVGCSDVNSQTHPKHGFKGFHNVSLKESGNKDPFLFEYYLDNERVVPGYNISITHFCEGSTPRKRNSSEKFCIIHIPKTAGTSLRNLIYSELGEENLIHWYPERQELTSITSLKDLNQYKGFIGHYPQYVGNFFQERPNYITFLRDPIERTLSFLQYMQKRVVRLQNKSLLEILESEKAETFNAQTKYLASHIRKNWSTSIPLDNAIENLKNFDFVGITEQFDLSKSGLEKTFGWQLGDSIVLNRNTQKAKFDNQDPLIKKIIQFNQHDIKLYQKALEIFEKQNKNLNL
jgi:hypothetical protein